MPLIPLTEIGQIVRRQLLAYNHSQPEPADIDEEVVIGVGATVAFKEGELDNVGEAKRESAVVINKYEEGNEYNNKPVDDVNRALNFLYGIATGEGVNIGGTITGGDLNVSPAADFRNTVAGRFLAPINDSQLAKIGLERLAIEFAQRFLDKQLWGRFPSINFRKEELGLDSTGNLTGESVRDVDVRNPNIEPAFISDTRALRFYYIGAPWREPENRLRDVNLPPNTAGGRVNQRDPNKELVYEEFGQVSNTGNIPDYNSEITDEYGFIRMSEIGDGVEFTRGFAWRAPDDQEALDNPEKGRFSEFLDSFKPRDNAFKRGLLRLTQQIVDDAELSKFSLAGKAINMKRKIIGYNNQNDTTIMDADGKFKINKDYWSRGSAVRNDENEFCRVHTIYDPYDHLGKLIRHKGYDASKGLQNSVLDSNGFLHIAPNANNIFNPFLKGATNPNMKNFMFSIENLAWKDSEAMLRLPDCEKGQQGGRIMWFAPYDLTFNDNSTVNWDNVTIIGRAEPIYTYNHTERTGNIDFKVIVDYPDELDDIRFLPNLSNDDLAGYFAGCRDLIARLKENPNVSKNTINAVETKVAEDASEVKKENTTSKTAPNPTFNDLKVYFENDSSTVNESYEAGAGELNEPFFSDFDAFMEYLQSDDGKRMKVILTGSSSKRGPSTDLTTNNTYNKDLASARASSVMDYLRVSFTDSFTIYNQTSAERWQIVVAGAEYASDPTDIDSDQEKSERVVTIRLQYNKNLEEEEEDLQPEVSPAVANPTVTVTTKQTCRWFERIEGKFIHAMRDKIKFFHPGFHSTSPIGFNERMNFLKQCTRQGPSIDRTENTPNNIAFGRPPVCILRLGDFYHTKIIIDNIQLSFDPLIWDLNPEGIGVQPMIATVNISFKFIGGSSLSEPIARLQNAISYNFFANTHVYANNTIQDRRSDEYLSFENNQQVIDSKDSSLLKIRNKSSEDALEKTQTNNTPSPG